MSHDPECESRAETVVHEGVTYCRSCGGRMTGASSGSGNTPTAGVMATDHDEVTYGCDESIPGNCRCDGENGWCGGDHPYEHICQHDEFHDGRHVCCCGRNWEVPCG